MKRVFKRPRVKRVKKPAPIEAPKPERPRRTELKVIYKDLISTSQEQRINTLRRALGWYDRCTAYVGHALEYDWHITQLKSKNAAERIRSAAINTTVPDNKEKLFLKSINYYQKLVKSYKSPSISIYLKKLRSERDKLEVRKRKLNKRYGEFLNTLKVVLAPRNSQEEPITLKVDKLSVEHRIDGKGNITFDNKYVAYLSKLSRKQGMLSAVIEIFPVLMEAAGTMDEVDLQNHRTGRVVISNSKCKASVVPMLKKLNQHFMHDNPRKLVRKPRVQKERVK